ncbi:MAG: hypothetical protein MnENMB40S_01310 [Rhizobiaceae bacterium MnEN-MB40S]|nr:MAG: hypothetical protein MnENMB40S_01310 [Rhizobiaceae bacterium MnEN-MB40S]
MRPFTIAAAALLAGALAFVTMTSEEVGQARERIHSEEDDGWRYNHHARFDEWETFCKHPVADSPGEGQAISSGQRCYMRLTDSFVAYDAIDFSPYEVTLSATIGADGKGMQVAFYLGEDLISTESGAYLQRDGKPVWSLNTQACDSQNLCVFTGPSAHALIDIFSDQTADELTLVWNVADGAGHIHSRNWPMASFANAHAELARISD